MIRIKKMTVVISLKYFVKMMKETIRPHTISLSLCLLGASFFTVRYFEDENWKPFFVDYFI